MSESGWIEGHVSRVLYVSEQSGYTVLKLQTVDGEVPVVGVLAAIAGEEDGAFVAVEGRYEEHPVHGRQFRAIGYLVGVPRTLEGLGLYLASAGISGVGKKTARRIVDHFGMETLTVLSSDPERLREVDGIGASRATAIAKRWAEGEDERALTITLRGLGLSGRLVERIRRRWPERALEVVRREPYTLAEEIRGVGFRTADEIAQRQGVPLDDPGRARAAVIHVVERDSGEGHCYLTREQLTERVRGLNVPVERVPGAISACEANGRVVTEEERVFSADLYFSERLVAMDLRERVGVQASLSFDETLVDRAMGYEAVALDPDQQQAVRTALEGGVVVITGGPGTGKTTLVKVLLRAALERGETWMLASPTGRAAKRLEEATGHTASTVHRLLEYNPGEGGFQRGQGNPIEADGLVVDEVSMVDITLMSALLRALPTAGAFSLVLVGDADQLPSVGAGQVLRDLIQSGIIPVARLSRIHRQGEHSGIIAGARQILGGQLPISGERAPYDDLFLLERDDPHKARETLLTVVSERLPRKGFSAGDIQVLSPTRKGPLGTQALNEALQQRLNPTGAPFKRGAKEFRVGDRVICTKNRYDVEVFNGDQGRISHFSAGSLMVLFDGREIAFSGEDIGTLELAYAITVHKSQGSEYPAVVLALHAAHGIMLRRNLFYTAATRARQFLCVIGNRRGWQRALSEAGTERRNTRLAARLISPV